MESLLRLMRKPVRTIYHEHFSYFSFATAQKFLPPWHQALRRRGCRRTAARCALRVPSRQSVHPKRQGVAMLDSGGGGSIEWRLPVRRASQATKRRLRVLIDAKRGRASWIRRPRKRNTQTTVIRDFPGFTVDQRNRPLFLACSHIPIFWSRRSTKRGRITSHSSVGAPGRDRCTMARIRTWGGRFVFRSSVTVLVRYFRGKDRDEDHLY